LDGETLSLQGEILAPDGSLRVAREVTATIRSMDEAYVLGYEMGVAVKTEVGGRITFDV